MLALYRVKFPVDQFVWKGRGEAVARLMYLIEVYGCCKKVPILVGKDYLKPHPMMLEALEEFVKRAKAFAASATQPPPPPEVAEELKQFLEERLRELPEDERERVRRAVEAWVLQVAGRTGRLETVKKNVEALKKIVEEVTKTHSPAVAAAFMKIAGEMGLSSAWVEGLGKILSDPATKRLADVLKSKHSVKELALYLAGVMGKEDLSRIWAESFPGTEIPEEVLRKLSRERVSVKYSVTVHGLQVLSEVLRAVVGGEDSGGA